MRVSTSHETKRYLIRGLQVFHGVNREVSVSRGLCEPNTFAQKKPLKPHACNKNPKQVHFCVKTACDQQVSRQSPAHHPSQPHQARHTNRNALTSDRDKEVDAMSKAMSLKHRRMYTNVGPITNTDRMWTVKPTLNTDTTVCLRNRAPTAPTATNTMYSAKSATR
jgi:hypothetical protein